MWSCGVWSCDMWSQEAPETESSLAVHKELQLWHCLCLPASSEACPKLGFPMTPSLSQRTCQEGPRPSEGASAQPPRSPRFCCSGTRGKRLHRGDLGLYGLCCRRMQRLRTRTPKLGQMTFMTCIQSLGLLLTFDYREILHKHLPPWNTDSHICS